MWLKNKNIEQIKAETVFLTRKLNLLGGWQSLLENDLVRTQLESWIGFRRKVPPLHSALHPTPWPPHAESPINVWLVTRVHLRGLGDWNKLFATGVTPCVTVTYVYMMGNSPNVGSEREVGWPKICRYILHILGSHTFGKPVWHFSFSHATCPNH